MLNDVLGSSPDTLSASLRVDELAHLLTPGVDVDDYMKRRGSEASLLTTEETAPENLSPRDPLVEEPSIQAKQEGPSYRLGDLDQELVELTGVAGDQMRQLLHLIEMCREALDDHCEQERCGRIRPDRLDMELARRADVEETYHMLIQRFNALDEEVTRRKEDLQSRFMTYLTEEKQRHFPEWAEEGAGAQGRETILRGVADQYDYHPKEISGVNDIRLLRLFRDALAYQDLMSNRDLAANKIKDKPDFLRPGVQGATQNLDAANRASLFQKLKETGDPKYAIALI